MSKWTSQALSMQVRQYQRTFAPQRRVIRTRSSGNTHHLTDEPLEVSKRPLPLEIWKRTKWSPLYHDNDMPLIAPRIYCCNASGISDNTRGVERERSWFRSSIQQPSLFSAGCVMNDSIFQLKLPFWKSGFSSLCLNKIYPSVTGSRIYLRNEIKLAIRKGLNKNGDDNKSKIEDLTRKYCLSLSDKPFK